MHFIDVIADINIVGENDDHISDPKPPFLVMPCVADTIYLKGHKIVQQF